MKAKKKKPKKKGKPGNSISILLPYWHGGTWVFDDPDKDLVKEAFVAGADAVITQAVKEKMPLAKAKKGFRLTFSAKEFPGFDIMLKWVEGNSCGNTYEFDGQQAWLCPALFKYFKTAPKKIFAKFDPV